MRMGVIAALALVVLAGWAGWRLLAPPAPALDGETRAALYRAPLPAPQGGMDLFHLGHSLVGRDMPAMVAQLAAAAGFADHSYHSQLGWGTSLRDHWDPDRPINGFEVENDHPRFRDARTALAGGVDALILTEMIDLSDAIRYHDSPRYLAHWAHEARQHAPEARVYFYETWHHWSAGDTWLERLDSDPEALWEGTILAQAMAHEGVGTVHVIPGGRAMAAFVRALEGQGGLPGLADRAGLFALDPEGAVDRIHLNDLGAYLIALVHVATLYHLDPRGLPHALLRADGSAADAPSAEAAALMQSVVHDVVRQIPTTGLPPG